MILYPSSYPVPLLNGTGWKDTGTWINIPSAEGFTREGSGDHMLIYQSKCQFAHDNKNLYLKVTAYEQNMQETEILDKYTMWHLDDAAELYLEKDDGILHQILFNAKGCYSYFRNASMDSKLAAEPEIHGDCGRDFWSATLKLPLAALELDMESSFRVKVLRNAPREFILHATEWGAASNGRPGTKLDFRPSGFTAEACRETENLLNRDFYNYLLNLPRESSVAAKFAVLPVIAKQGAEDLLAQSKIPADIEEARKLFDSFRAYIYHHYKSHYKENLADFSQKYGRIKRLNGTNGAQPLTDRTFWDLNDAFGALRFSTVRYHDIPLQNPGMKIVDTSMIFNRPDADAADPGNYYFEQTDDYVANTLPHNTQIIYRLGPSIEHSVKKYFVKAPADYNHFAEICAGIVRHYNAGWANGFEYGIQYWEIWNEPDLGPAMWDKTLDDYAMMYITVARRLKAEFPDIKIGGPATTTLNATIMKNFLTKCKAADAPVDFISWHRYTKRPEDLADQAKLAYLLAADCGYPEAELHLNEWHYMPEDFNTLRLDSKARERLLTSPEGMHGIDSAAFNAAALTLWQDTPLAMSNFYNSTGSWGLFDRFYNPMRVYDSFLAFAPFADHLQRVWTQSCSSNCTILAGTDESGTNGMILISAFRMESNSISLQIKGISPDTELLVEAAEADHGLAEHPYNFADGTLTLGKSSKSAIFRIMLKNIK